MRRLLMLAGLSVLPLGSAGCIFNQYPSDPQQRMNAVINQSENERQLGAEWRRIWFNDQPSTLTPARISGAIAPAPIRNRWEWASQERQRPEFLNSKTPVANVPGSPVCFDSISSAADRPALP